MRLAVHHSTQVNKIQQIMKQTNSISYTIDTGRGVRDIVLTCLGLEQDRKYENVKHFKYYYNSDADKYARQNFETRFYQADDDSRATCMRLVSHAVKALHECVDLSTFDAMVVQAPIVTVYSWSILQEVKRYADIRVSKVYQARKDKPSKVLVITDTKANGNHPYHSFDSQAEYFHDTEVVVFSPLPQLHDSLHRLTDDPLLCEAPRKKDCPQTLKALLAEYAAKHPEGFNLFIPEAGDLREVVQDMLTTQQINAHILGAPKHFLDGEQVYDTVTEKGTAFSRHYADNIDKARGQLWKYTHFCNEAGEWDDCESVYWVKRFDDEEMRQLVIQSLAESNDPCYDDVRLVDGKGLVIIYDQVYRDHYKDSINPWLDQHLPSDIKVVRLTYNRRWMKKVKKANVNL